MPELQVALVAADREVWSGEATMVQAKTLEGDIGILPQHAPLLGVLAPGPVQVQRAEGPLLVAIDGGFLSVAEDRVSILVEQAAFSEDIDVAEAEAELARAEQEGDAVAALRARTRINVASGRLH